MKRESLDNFQVIIHDRQVFHPGEKLTGVVQLSASKVVNVKRLFVKICGQAYVKWTESRQFESTEFVNCENYLNDSRVLSDSTGNNDFETLLPGSNQFPFHFVIPASHLPSSYYHGWDKKNYAVIRYWISASICLINDEEVTVSQEFYLKEIADLTHVACLQEPQTMSTEEYISWCCFKAGSVTTNMEINRSAYHPEDDILITANIKSALSSCKTRKVEVQLMQRVNFIADSGYTRDLCSKMSEVNSLEKEHWNTEKSLLLSSSVTSRREINWSNVRLKIPKATIPTISCSKCIQLSYFVQLRVSFRAIPEDCIIRIPIIIICKPREYSLQKTRTESIDESPTTSSTH
jgi:hypothetical protein